MKEALTFDLEKTSGDFKLRATGSFKPGITALFGHSGAGKTTILNMLAGIELPDEGAVAYGDSHFYNSIMSINLPPEKRRIGYVFQDDALFPHMTVLENLAFGSPRGNKGALWTKLIKVFGLKKLLERTPATLSGGEKKRVAIVRALLSDPQILLLDEPLANIDARRREAFFPYLDILKKEFEIPIVYVSHQLEEVIRLADYMAFIRDGKIEKEGPLADVFGTTVFQLSLGKAERGTLLEGQVLEVVSGLAKIDIGGGELLSSDKKLKSGTKIRIRLLAKDVGLALQKPKDISILNILPCRVEEIEKNFSGNVELDLAIEQIAGKKTIIHAEITNRSALQLRLKKGLSVYALIKALAIISPAV
ncbi:MAG: molybdenum ABC transporter ATP-binding protein [Sphingomonadales bacterium]